MGLSQDIALPSPWASRPVAWVMSHPYQSGEHGRCSGEKGQIMTEVSEKPGGCCGPGAEGQGLAQRQHQMNPNEGSFYTEQCLSEHR